MKTVFALAVLCVWIYAGAASAQANIALGGAAYDPDAPIEVTSDTLRVDQTTGTAVFEGNVKVVQGDIIMTAALMNMIYTKDTEQIDRIDAFGGVTVVTPAEAAEAQTASYDVLTRMLEMQGDVLLTQGPTVMQSDKMIVDLDTGTAQLEGRVKTVLQQGN